MKYFAAIDTGNIGVYTKATHQFAAPYSSVISADTLFGDFHTTLNKAMNLPSTMCDQASPAVVYYPSGPNKGRIASNAGCIQDSYDSRVIYDTLRHRRGCFWTEWEN